MKAVYWNMMVNVMMDDVMVGDDVMAETHVSRMDHMVKDEERVFRNILGSLFSPCSLQTKKAPTMRKASTPLKVPVTSP